MMPYKYIRRAYGVQFMPGMRVTFSEYDNAPGVVKRVRGDPQYVAVRFDDGREGNCHPSSLTVEEQCE